MFKVPVKKRISIIIFGTDTPAGKAFDVALLWAILLSVLAVMLESVKAIDAEYHVQLETIEWVFTVLFTLEYALRIYVTRKPLNYIFSFYGIIDLLSILPTYLGLVVGGAESLMVIRSLRLLRVFRVLKLTRYLGESMQLTRAIFSSRRKILVFIFAVLALTIVMGTVMYIVEGGKNGFDSIPHSIYWAIVTLTTVGYGDISPQTTVGKFLASVIMILGYGIIAVPTGIVTANMKMQGSEKKCVRCHTESTEKEAVYCHKCGEKLPHEN